MKVISTIAMSEDGPIGATGGDQGWEMATGDNTLDGCCWSLLEQKPFRRWNVSEGFKKYIKIKTQIGTVSSPPHLASLPLWTRESGQDFKGAGGFLALPLHSQFDLSGDFSPNN